MSTINTALTKKPLKLIEVPLYKFKEEVIPHHQNVYETHKALVLKLISINDVNQVSREVRDKKRIVKQLKDLMYELDTLRAEVEQLDLDKFDQRTLSLRKEILTLKMGYDNLEKMAQDLQKPQEVEQVNKNINPFEGAANIQLQENLDEIKLKDAKDNLQKVENIHRDIKDLHEMYGQLNEMVGEQRTDVEHVEESIESTKTNVDGGVKHLIKAYKLKSAAYPATGALIGTVLGGPIGAVAGLKVGALAAIGCAVAGYTGGILFKKKINDTETVQQVAPPIESEDQKKDI